jgi:hypothetical protein
MIEAGLAARLFRFRLHAHRSFFAQPIAGKAL